MDSLALGADPLGAASHVSDQPMKRNQRRGAEKNKASRKAFSKPLTFCWVFNVGEPQSLIYTPPLLLPRQRGGRRITSALKQKTKKHCRDCLPATAGCRWRRMFVAKGKKTSSSFPVASRLMEINQKGKKRCEKGRRERCKLKVRKEEEIRSMWRSQKCDNAFAGGPLQHALELRATAGT